MRYSKVLTLAGVIVVVGLLFWIFGDSLSLAKLAAREAELREWRTKAPWWTALGALAIYVLVTGLSLPGAAALTLTCGWFFGFWPALVLVSLGSTSGALVAFLLSRYLLRDWVQSHLGERFRTMNDAFAREGAYYLFTLRLVPAVPFFAINAVMGLTKIRATTFWWVSQLGMLPGTAAYVYAGSVVPSLQVLAAEGLGKIISGRMLLAFVMLGLLPLVIRKVMALRRQNPAPASHLSADSEMPSAPSKLADPSLRR